MTATVATCPLCAGRFRMTPDDPAPPPLSVVKPAPADDLTEARPAPIHRGAGRAREVQWGARVDRAVKPGDRLRVTARSGKTWTATVAEVLDGGLVSTTGARWKPDPDTDVAPPWLTDTTDDVVPAPNLTLN